MEQDKRDELVCAGRYRQFKICSRNKHLPLFCLYIVLCTAVLFCLVWYFSAGEDPVRNFEKLNLPPDAADLKAVHVMPFNTLSDMDIYVYDRLDDETREVILADGIDKYVKIAYWYLGGRPDQWDLIKK